MLDGEVTLGGNLVFYLHGKSLLGGRVIQLLELLMDRLQMGSQLIEVLPAHQQLTRGNLIGKANHGVVVGVAGIEKNLLGNGLGFRVGYEVLANLRVEIIITGSLIDGIIAHRDTVSLFIAEIRVKQHPHSRYKLVDAVKIACFKSAKVPETGVDLLDGF